MAKSVEPERGKSRSSLANAVQSEIMPYLPLPIVAAPEEELGLRALETEFSDAAVKQAADLLAAIPKKRL